MRIAGNDHAAIVRVTDKIKALLSGVVSSPGSDSGPATAALLEEIMAVLEEARGDGFLIPCKAMGISVDKAEKMAAELIASRRPA